ncbi:MAG: triose-phosphate isomerase [Desulfovibrionaceae bacterium]|nr:triose-phosphate isomerase [Desulfovibrionaceae bacterium]
MQKIIAANWKMYKNRVQAAETANALVTALRTSPPSDRQVLVFAPFTALSEVSASFANLPWAAAGAQNFYPAEEGAFTGEISPAMLRDVGAEWLLVGHSERRHILGEGLELIARKAVFGLAQGFKIMLCVGETLAEREAGKLADVLDAQLSSVLEALPTDTRASLPGRFAVAYEPVWAIGTGKVAGPDEVLDAHAQVRSLLARHVKDDAAHIPLLYGGSVKAGNASVLLGLDNVDGLLVGGASLEAQSFLQIIGA